MKETLIHYFAVIGILAKAEEILPPKIFKKFIRVSLVLVIAYLMMLIYKYNF